jgi:hypothetical protein
MLGTADFTATSGTSVVLAAGATAGDLIRTESFFVSSVLNAIPAVANAVTTSYINDGAVTKAKMAASGAWAPAGTVLQVVNVTYGSATSTGSTSRSDTGLSASITPSSSSNKILVFVNMAGCSKNSGTSTGPYMAFWLMRNSTDIIKFEGEVGYTGNTNANSTGACSTTYLDSPATTSSTTYKVQFNNSAASGGTVAFNSSSSVSTITLMEIAV